MANSYYLTAAGVELPDVFAQQNMPGLGMPRVRLQVEQLGGMLTTERTPLGILFASTFRTCARRTAPARAGSGRVATARPERLGPLNRLQHGSGAAKLAAQAQGGVGVGAHLAGPAREEEQGQAHGRRSPRTGSLIDAAAGVWARSVGRMLTRQPAPRNLCRSAGGRGLPSLLPAHEGAHLL